MGPREKMCLSKKKGLVFKQLGIYSIFMDINGSRGNDVETFQWRSTLEMKREDGEVISPAVVEENLPNILEYEDLCFSKNNKETKTVETIEESDMNSWTFRRN